MTEKLKPCPFCGYKEIMLSEIPPHKHTFVNLPDYDGSFTIECPQCKVGFIRHAKNEVIEAWNRRNTDADNN